MPHDALGLLQDISAAIQFIEEDTAGLTLDEFIRDRRRRHAVERNFVTIGEAVNQLRRDAPAVASRISARGDIVDFRNVLIHDYRAINERMVWRTIHESLPILRAEVEMILKEQDEFPASEERNP